MTPSNQQDRANTLVQAARRLWFGSYHGILSTHAKAVPDYPFGSLVTMCRDYDGYALLLLSHLAQHTQNLHDNPHCSILTVELNPANIQQSARLSCLARAEPLKDISTPLLRRYYRYFPDSREYYENLNFRFYRLIPQRFYFVGGFGATRWFDPSRMLANPAFSDDEENKWLDVLKSSSQIFESNTQTTSPIGIDPLGLDLMQGETISRIMFAEPVSTLEQVLESLRQIGHGGTKNT
ncbi:MAG: pyridoxamine 5'-phosphate oxidase family protein [Gammaproteobacteria bacterium]|nr:pyridoxamine 5'-phosphate oxidase family protein [Gammaproteobacteria bacterium]